MMRTSIATLSIGSDLNLAIIASAASNGVALFDLVPASSGILPRSLGGIEQAEDQDS